VKQDCVLSPMLFNIVLDFFLRQAYDQDKGIRWSFNGDASADDIGFLVHSFEDDWLSEEAMKVGLKININKTKQLRIH